jgi:hypothetical protein
VEKVGFSDLFTLLGRPRPLRGCGDGAASAPEGCGVLGGLGAGLWAAWGELPVCGTSRRTECLEGERTGACQRVVIAGRRRGGGWPYGEEMGVSRIGAAFENDRRGDFAALTDEGKADRRHVPD